jgi:hypothetical protein
MAVMIKMNLMMMIMAVIIKMILMMMMMIMAVMIKMILMMIMAVMIKINLMIIMAVMIKMILMMIMAVIKMIFDADNGCDVKDDFDDDDDNGCDDKDYFHDDNDALALAVRLQTAVTTIRKQKSKSKYQLHLNPCLQASSCSDGQYFSPFLYHSGLILNHNLSQLNALKFFNVSFARFLTIRIHALLHGLFQRFVFVLRAHGASISSTGVMKSFF